MPWLANITPSFSFSSLLILALSTATIIVNTTSASPGSLGHNNNNDITTTTTTTGGSAIPLFYNEHFNPDSLDLLTQGILKYGLFPDVKNHKQLNGRLNSVLRGLKLDAVNLKVKIGSTIKLNEDGVLDIHATTAAIVLKAREKRNGKGRLAQGNSSTVKARHAIQLHDNDEDEQLHIDEEEPILDKRLLGLELGSTVGLNIGSAKKAPSTSSSSSSTNIADVSVTLGLQTIIDPGWDDIASTRLMNSQNDNAWFANISFGTPSQTLTMLIDSGSADTTVFSPLCTSCELTTHQAFDYPSSTSFTSTTTSFQTQYGDGTTMSGFLGKDIVHLTGYLATPATQLLAIITSQLKGTGARLYDGILGIGPDPLSFVDGNITPFSNLVKANRIIRPIASVLLIKSSSPQSIVGGGEYRWGGINAPFISGSIVYTPVTSAYYWGVDMPGIYVSGTQMFNPTEPKRAIIDTGTTLVYTSNNAASNIHAQISGSIYNANEGAWYVPCSISSITGYPNIFFEIGNSRWGIPIEDLAFRPSGLNNGLCLSGIQGGSNSFTVLGDVFIKNHYLILSFGNTQQTALSVGLANRTDVPPIL